MVFCTLSEFCDCVLFVFSYSQGGRLRHPFSFGSHSGALAYTASVQCLWPTDEEYLRR